MTYKYTQPIITDSKKKPKAFAGRSFPYSSLEDNRRFEELIYSIYKLEIEDGNLKGKFDEIKILQGVRERGRDCSLHIKGKNFGLIQCKFSIDDKTRISAPECAREIIKFVLHFLLDNHLIYDEDNFLYYFSVSYGFTENALILLNDFNNKITKEEDFEKWTKYVINNNDGLKSHSYNLIENDLKRILQKIKIKTLVPQDYNLLLNKAQRETIIKTFFEVRTVVETKPVEDLVKEIRKNNEHSDISKTPAKRIVQKFEEASYHLLEYQDSFENVNDSHIERLETDLIYQWVKAPIGENDPIALLVGNAGTGKTVILKDLFKKLYADAVPTIGLKADRYYVNSIKELEDKINLEDSIEKSINKLKEEHDKIVIIIDQIDALSQSLSANRSFIDTFNLLVRGLVKIDDVRVIISCREYDLNYDTSLQSYKGKKTIKVDLLKEQDVRNILIKLGLHINLISSELISLLRTPLNLNVFCKVYNSDVSTNSIKSLHDLYNELWKQKILSVKPESLALRNVKQLVYTIAKDMYKRQTLSLSTNLIDEDLSSELSYLKSNEIVHEKDNSIYFFHQTFYDYSFAKQFTENNNSINKYILENGQSLFIRSSLKMIINFYRDKEHTQYISLYNSVLFSSKYRFHLKLLLINLLGYQNTITKEEIVLVEQKIFKNDKLKRIFLESVNSKDWLTYLINKNVLDTLIFPKVIWFEKNEVLARCLKFFFRKEMPSYNERVKNGIHLCQSVLQRHLPNERKNILNFLMTLEDFLGKGQFVLRLLYFVELWDERNALKLFEKYVSESKKNRFDYYKILEDAVKYDIEWVIDIYSSDLFERINNKIISVTDKLHMEHYEGMLIEKLFNTNKEKTFDFCLSVVMLISDKTSGSTSVEDGITLYGDWAFYMFDYDRNSHFSDYNSIYKMLIDYVQEFSQSNQEKFKSFLDTYKDSNSITVLKLIIYGLTANSQEFSNDIFEFIKLFDKKGGLKSEGSIQYLFRQLLKSSYDFFSQNQKDTINEIILNIQSDHEMWSYSDKITGKMRLGSRFGQSKYTYLQAIGEVQALNQPVLRKTYQELKRRFSIVKDEEPHKIRAFGVGAPLSNTAYETMTFKQWEASFIKYNEDLKREFCSAKGGIHEHSVAFKEAVKKNPNHFVTFIERLIDENKVPEDYIVNGLSGLQEGKCNVQNVLRLYKKAIKIPMNDYHTTHLVWLSSYFIKNKQVDYVIVKFLADMSLNHSNPLVDDDNLKNPLQHGINTVRGASIIRILELSDDLRFKELILNTVSLAIEDKAISVKVSIMSKLAHLMHIDQKKTLEFFLYLIQQSNEDILKHSVWSVQFLSNYYFKELIPYLHMAMDNNEIQKSISEVLAYKWLNGIEESYPILKKILEKNDKVKARIINIASDNILTDTNTINSKSQKLYEMYLNNASDEIVRAYNLSFLSFKNKSFDILYPLIKKYAKSKVAKKGSRNYFEFLAKNSKTYPYKCLELISYFGKYDKPDLLTDTYSGDEPMQVLIGAYNALSKDVKEDRKYIKISMKLFDNMLESEHVRRAANNVLENVER